MELLSLLGLPSPLSRSEQTSADSTVCPEFPKNRVWCLSDVRIFCPMSFCPNFVSLDSVRCPDSARNFRKNAVRCLSVRPRQQGRDRAVRTFGVLFRRRLVRMSCSGHVDEQKPE